MIYPFSMFKLLPATEKLAERRWSPGWTPPPLVASAPTSPSSASWSRTPASSSGTRTPAPPSLRASSPFPPGSFGIDWLVIVSRNRCAAGPPGRRLSEIFWPPSQKRKFASDRWFWRLGTIMIRVPKSIRHLNFLFGFRFSFFWFRIWIVASKAFTLLHILILHGLAQAGQFGHPKKSYNHILGTFPPKNKTHVSLFLASFSISFFCSDSLNLKIAKFIVNFLY